VASNRQRPKGAEEPAVVKGDQTERNDDKEDRFLVNVPTKEEGSVATQRDCANKRLPRRFVEQSKKDRLLQLALETRSIEQILTIWAPRVKRKQVRGTTSGRTAKDVSPTKPRVTLFTASGSTFNPRRGPPVCSSQRCLVRWYTQHTIDEETVHERIHRPYIGCPICVAQST
jgi:hypothetical protein